MLYNDPNNPLQPPPDPHAQPGYPSQQADPNAQSGYSYAPQNGQPGYPYGTQNAQPGYQPPTTNLPPMPVWQPGSLHPGLPPTSSPQKPARSRTRSVAIFALTCLLAVVFGVGLFSGWTYATSSANLHSSVVGSTSPSTTVSTALDSQSAREAAIAKVMPAVVEVIGQVSQGTALGSGVIVDKNGNIVTNNHVVNGASSLQVVLSNGHNVAAQLVGTDPANDLAVLRIQPYAGMAVATLGDSSKLTIGQEVLAIGNPLGYSGTATSGVVSALNRNAQESRSVNLNGLIQISTPINPGNSGGALINLQGEVVGVPTLSAVDSETNTPANGIGFAIPSSQVKAALTQILK
ncbi:MAG TPA: trypsin-like peptidase domain-containing protein [Ktedonobacteraceae bacterium]|nr:trypsin-like peptidase domain-containing protein [Ktedonobacteraceae bacterium]